MSNVIPQGFLLGGKVAVVTGAAGGIGAGVAQALAEAGAFVVVVDIHRENAQRQVEVLLAAGHRAAALFMDLASEESIVRGCAEITEKYGAPWILVNNAGLQNRQSFLESTADDWDRMQRVNSRAPYLLSREIGRAMVGAGQGGRIINIGSAALRGSIAHGLVSYSASKGALLGLSSSTAFELAQYGVTVNTVLPGGVATPGALAATGPAPEGPARRPLPLGMCQPEDIAAAVLYFASPAARRVTNQILAIDGGFSVT